MARSAVGRSTDSTVAFVAEVLSNNSPSPLMTSPRGDGTLSSSVIETGAAFFPVPHEDGLDPMSNSSTPPREMIEWGSEVFVQALLLTFRPCT